ncbi:MAG: M20 metallopeptidase family protein [Thermoplasmata archaeon]
MIDLPLVERIFERMRKFRRHIHSNPEIGMETPQTRDYVIDLARELGFRYREIGNGAVVDSGMIPTVALRADMDCLPIEEKTGLPFASKVKGRMHACGHDMHTAILMGAMIYAKERGMGNLRFIFQPGEEIGKGASMMIQGGALMGVKRIFGLHAWPSLNVGEYGICRGRAMAAVDEFEIVVKGEGGHGAYPHLAFDSILEASRLSQLILTVPARKIDPLDSAVVSIGYIHGGNAKNVIPQEVRIGGTVRTFRAEDSRIIESEITKLKGEHVDVEYKRQLPPLINNDEFSLLIDSIASRYVRKVDVSPTMGGEDFAFYCGSVQCAFAFLGTGKIGGKDVSKHSSTFDLNEEAMKYGLVMQMAAAEAGSK